MPRRFVCSKCFLTNADELLADHLLAQRSSAGTAGARVSVETGWRVKATESMADRAAPAVGASALFALVLVVLVLMMSEVKGLGQGMNVVCLHILKVSSPISKK